MNEKELYNEPNIEALVAGLDGISPASSDGVANCEALLKKTAENPGAPFEPEALTLLRALRRDDAPAFEQLRSKLKKLGCRVTALDDAIDEKSGASCGRSRSQADLLIELAQSAELFHTPDGTGYADLHVNGHRETWGIRTKGFRRWLTRRYFEETGGASSSEATQSALNVIEAKAHFDAPERVVYARVGGHDGKIYIDLCGTDWRVVEIGPDGWCVINDPPVRFRRAGGMLPLPIPQTGGSVESLRKFLNVRSGDDFVLVVAWLLAALRHRGPYPVLVLTGEQGSAKSHLLKILRALIDPNSAPLRALPREDRDLFIAATNGHVLTFDNVSGLPPWISDSLCRLATGGGFAVRQLYTDQEETLFDACRPVGLNGIEDIVTRPDLADRALILALEAIPENRRRSEATIWTEFESERPGILGALLDAIVVGLQKLAETELTTLPRMADFALWATACESAIWRTGTFAKAYSGNRADMIGGVIDNDPVATAVRTLMDELTVWTGTASDLLGALETIVGERVARSKSWPSTPKSLAGQVRRAATFLRKLGIDISFDREGKARTRVIRITKTALDSEGIQPSASSASSASGSSPMQSRRTIGGVADGADAKIPTQSGLEDSLWRARL